MLFGRTQNNDASIFGIAIFRAESDDAARMIMNKDPVEGRNAGRAFPLRNRRLKLQLGSLNDLTIRKLILFIWKLTQGYVVIAKRL